MTEGTRPNPLTAPANPTPKPWPAMDAAAELDRALVDWRHRDRWSDAWIEPAGRWSRAVWERAVELGPLPIPATDIAAGKRVANAPAYVCGAPRSGTTLVRDLLDGHPALAVLPSEGKFFEAFGNRDFADGPDAVAAQGQRWLRLLANPNHQQPFWLLGRSDGQESAYVAFARAFLTWNTAIDGHEFAFRLQPMVALSLAAAAPRQVAQLRRSVDKTPGYEFHLKAIWARFPEAKVIQVVRDPAAVAASYSAGLARTHLDYTPVSRILRNVASSLFAAWRARHFSPTDRFLIVRYEDIVANRRREMDRIASFLGIEWDDCLLRQTIMRLPAEPNSSFHGIDRVPFEPANASERLWLALASRCHSLLR